MLDPKTEGPHLIWPRLRALQKQSLEQKQALVHCQVVMLQCRSLRERLDPDRTPMADIIGE